MRRANVETSRSSSGDSPHTPTASAIRCTSRRCTTSCGAIALRRGDLEGAAEYLTRAVAIAQRQGARSLELRSAASRFKILP
jgi:hypothetical protein